jgi:hypothetical protein
MLGKCFTTELQTQPLFLAFLRILHTVFNSDYANLHSRNSVLLSSSIHFPANEMNNTPLCLCVHICIILSIHPLMGTINVNVKQK